MRTDYYWPGITIQLLLFNLIIKETSQFCLNMSGGKTSGRQFDVKACWSKAGIGTSIVLQQRSENNKGFKLVFDLGCTPVFDQAISASAIILSHGHIDHFGGIFSHARAHNLQCSGSTPSYYIPEHLVTKIEKAREIFSDIDATCSHDDNSSHKRDQSFIAMNIIPIKGGQEIEIKQSKVKNGVRFYLQPFHVSHGGHPAYGYTVVSRTTTSGLKVEYQGLDGKELGKLARNGVDIKETRLVEKPEICYTGDTCIDGLLLRQASGEMDDNHSWEYLKQGFRAPLLLSELTYLDPKDSQLARERGHLNIMDISPILQSHGWNSESAIDDTAYRRSIIFYHVSGKHGPAKHLLEMMANNLSNDVVEVADVAIASFLSSTSQLDIEPNGCISLKGFKSGR